MTDLIHHFSSVLDSLSDPYNLLLSFSRIGTYAVSKNNRQGISWQYTELQTQCILLLDEQVLTIFLCIKWVRLKWNFIVYDVQNATYSSHGAPCPSQDLFPWLNTIVKVHIYVWRIIMRISERTFLVPLGFGGYLLTIVLIIMEESQEWLNWLCIGLMIGMSWVQVQLSANHEQVHPWWFPNRRCKRRFKVSHPVLENAWHVKVPYDQTLNPSIISKQSLTSDPSLNPSTILLSKV